MWSEPAASWNSGLEDTPLLGFCVGFTSNPKTRTEASSWVCCCPPPATSPRQTGEAKGREGDSAGSSHFRLPIWGVESPGQRKRKGQRGPALFQKLGPEEGSCAILPLVMTPGDLRSPGAYVALLSLPTASPAHGVSSVPKTETAFWAHPLGFAWLALEALRIGASTPGVESPPPAGCISFPSLGPRLASPHHLPTGDNGSRAHSRSAPPWLPSALRINPVSTGLQVWPLQFCLPSSAPQI